MQTRNRWLGLLPGLMLGAASIAKDQGLFGNIGGLTDAELKGNNAGWRNMGLGRLPDGSINPAMVGEPMQLPGAQPGMSLSGMSSHPMLPPITIGRPREMPPFAPQAATPPQPQAWAAPQAQPPGLLSDPNEESRRRFLQAQGVGPAMNIGMR